jgi:CRP-like cAMP-binding protein
MQGRDREPPRNGFEPRNWVLATLPPEDRTILRPHLEPVALPRGKVRLEAGEALTHAYFVETGVVALVAVLRSGATAVSAFLGREGVVGLAALLGGNLEVGRYVVHVAGSAWTMEVSGFRAALRQTPRLRARCQAYAIALLGQVLQNTACHGVHTVAERCARSLLVIHDRSQGDTLPLSWESFARMLGLAGPNAALVIRTLQGAGLVRCSREGIRVLDRARLEAAACECYAIDRARYDRLLPGLFDRRQRSPAG